MSDTEYEGLIIWNPEMKPVISIKDQIQKCDSNIYEGTAILGDAEYVIVKGDIVKPVI